jgi:hypothetical protein
MACVRLVEPQNVRPQQRTADVAHRQVRTPRIGAKRVERVGCARQAALVAAELAARAAAAQAVGAAVHLDQLARAGRAMQAVDVLRDEEHLAAGLRLPELEHGERVMRRIGHGALDAVEAVEVPRPRLFRVIPEESQRAALHDVIRPDGAVVDAAKRGQARGQAHAGARHHQQLAGARVLERLTQLGRLDQRQLDVTMLWQDPQDS